jgi:hypothetical protein
VIIYKSSAFIIVKNVIYSILGGIAVALILSWFIDANLAVIIGGAVGLLIIYFVLIGDNIRVEIDGDRLSFYRFKKLKHEFSIGKSGFNARIKTTDGDSDCTLTVIQENGEETYIDCSMLGKSRFYKLLDALRVTDPEPVEVETKKK